MKKALITGIAGQDGYYLAELLFKKGYEVHGLLLSNNLNPKLDGVTYHAGDLADMASVKETIFRVAPDEIYNLAAKSSVRESFENPERTYNITGLGALRVFESARKFRDQSGKLVKIYQASSSEMFGSAPPPQSEKTPFHPRSPYACAKVLAYHTAINYREAYGMHICNGILFNHESPRRPDIFVTRKITKGVADIKKGLKDKIILGNLDVRRDWGYAPEYMEAAWLMMQQPEPDDYVIGTGELHSLQEFVELAFRSVGINDWQNYVEIDPAFLRPADITDTVADFRKAKEKLGWEPKTKFPELVKLMVEADLKE